MNPILLFAVAIQLVAQPFPAFSPDRIGTRYNTGPPSLVPSTPGSAVLRDRPTAGDILVQTGGGLAGGALVIGIHYAVPYLVKTNIGEMASRVMNVIGWSTTLGYPPAVAGGICLVGGGAGNYADAAIGACLGALAGGLAGWGIGAAVGKPERGGTIGYTVGTIPGALLGYNWNRLR